jgi:nicotinate-nucleotide adenylyltransferase
MRIGLLGGTFDPPHIGHLVLGDQAWQQLGLDEVWFTPVGQPPHKAGRVVSAAPHRTAMTRAAIGGHAAFRLCELDVQRPGPHYSLTLMQLLRERHPEHEWFFLIGEDSLADLPKWHRPDALIELVTLCVARRPGSRADHGDVFAFLPALRERLRWIDAPLLDLSSSDLRARLVDGRSVRYLVPDAALAYAEMNAVYRRVRE